MFSAHFSKSKLSPSFSSLWNRFLLIIAVPIILLQIVTVCIFYMRHWSHVNDHMHSSLINEVKWIVSELDAVTAPRVGCNRHNRTSCTNTEIATYAKSQHEIMRTERAAIYRKASEMFEITVTDEPHVPHLNKLITNHYADTNLRELATDLSHAIHHDVFNMQYTNQRKQVQCVLRMHNGEFTKIVFSSTRIRSGTTRIFVLWIISSAILLFVIAWLFAKNQIRSIVRLTNAVQNWSNDIFGKDCAGPQFIPSGPGEIVAAGNAFLRMKERLENSIKERIQFLAYIAHDMRTPLTRMRLKLAVFEKTTKETYDLCITQTENGSFDDNCMKHRESERNQLLEIIGKNIEELQSLLDGYLEFAKSGETERCTCANLHIIVKCVTDVFTDNRLHFVESTIMKRNYSGKADKEHLYTMQIQVNSMKRALHNIIDNALRFAIQKVVISLERKGDFCVIAIDDDGPGINTSVRKDFLTPIQLNRSPRLCDGGLIDNTHCMKCHETHQTNSTETTTLNEKNCRDTEGHKGFGLGLAIAKSIVTNNDGNITFEKSELGGLCVKIVLHSK